MIRRKISNEAWDNCEHNGCGGNMRRSTRNKIVSTIFRLIWSQTANDCDDDFKIKKNYNYNREMRGKVVDSASVLVFW